MFSDTDIKIASDRPSDDVKRNRRVEADNVIFDKETAKSAKEVGKAVAEKFINEANGSFEDDGQDYNLMLQRRLLLSFTATVNMESVINNDALAGIAQKSFLDELKKRDGELYKTSSDMGAFSFYYLAYRRGTETERRIGQTFAMLCSHDGDPIFQELGEALYCWFSSEIRKITETHFNKLK